ncbi:MAG: serine hydrolase [Chitinophagaceae bacterium]
MRLLFLMILLCSIQVQAQMKVNYPDKMGPFPELRQTTDEPSRTLKPISVFPSDLHPIQNLAEVGISDPLTLYKADALINKAIDARAFPGCRVLAAKDGKIFYDKAFGYFTYDKTTPVQLNTVYDLASLTKVVSTTLCVMHLYEQGKLALDKTLGDYLPFTIGTDKAELTIRNLLLHQAGLKAWIPFYKAFYDSTGQPSDTIFHKQPDAKYTIEVAQNMYLRSDYRDTIWHRILESPLENKGRYVYSDLDYYFLAAVVQKLTGQPINRYVTDNFYTPMGLRMIGYLPLQFLKKSLIAPTENDLTFRHQVLQGYVHDPGAALFGGVAGHAGVFASAEDVAAIFQMLLNGGKYHGRSFFKPETIQMFTAYGSTSSRRGIGFDKPDADADDGGPSGKRTSGYTFGHQGFTGTCAWADPENGVVYVFLSNRVYPDQDNKLINVMNVRTDVQDILYEALGIPINKERANLRKAQLNVFK